jgi:hypothetical protein
MADATHCLIAGSSGSGKTVLARMMHRDFSGISVFLTPKESEPVLQNSPPESIVEPLCKYDSDIERVQMWARNREEKVQIIVDECQMSGLADGTGPVVDGLHFDREHSIKWVLVTQSPQDLSDGYSALQQCKRIYWVGPARTFHTGFLRYYKLSDIDFPDRFRWIRITPSIPPVVDGPFKTRKALTD